MAHPVTSAFSIFLTLCQLGRVADSVRVDQSLHQIICGRHRKNIKLIESSTGTAIYFPPLFSQMYRYCPPNASRRDPNDVYITGENPQAIRMAKEKIHETVTRIRLYIKDVTIPAAKIDSILLDRPDKVRKILEAHGTYIMFPALGTQRTTVRVQGNEGLPVERTVRELMTLVSWHLTSNVSFHHLMLMNRPANSTLQAGTCNSPKPGNCLAPRTFVACLVIFVQHLVPILCLTS